MNRHSFNSLLATSVSLRFCLLAALLRKRLNKVCILVTRTGKKHLVFRVAIIPWNCDLDELSQSSRETPIFFHVLRRCFKSARKFMKRWQAIEDAKEKLRQLFGPHIAPQWIKWIDVRNTRLSFQ